MSIFGTKIIINVESLLLHLIKTFLMQLQSRNSRNYNSDGKGNGSHNKPVKNFLKNCFVLTNFILK